MTLTQQLCLLLNMLGAGGRGFLFGHTEKGGSAKAPFRVDAGGLHRVVPSQLLELLGDTWAKGRLRLPVFDIPDLDFSAREFSADEVARRNALDPTAFQPTRLAVITVRWDFRRAMNRRPDRFEETRQAATDAIGRVPHQPTFVIDADTERIAGWALRTPIDVTDETSLGVAKMLSIELARAAGADASDVDAILSTDIPIPGTQVRRPFANCRVECTHLDPAALYAPGQLQATPPKQTASRGRREQSHARLN